MSTGGKSRRRFLIESAVGIGGAWVAANYPGILAAAEHVGTKTDGRLAFFSPEQALEVDAMASQIIPTDATPGAREAQVVRFIDRILVTFERGAQRSYTEGLEELAAQTKRRFPAAERFSELTSDQQIAVLTGMEATPFFRMVRTHTITGFFASPIHGGNHDRIGWELVGYDDSLEHEPPFGYYDALPLSRR
jgi:gluconate 2-dehydrogenase gamma chain